MTVLGQRIRYLRQKANLTQAQLGKLLGCSSSTVSLYEGGQRSPDTDMLIRLADVFSVSVDYLLGRVSDPTQREKTESSLVPEGGWSVAEDLTPEGAELLEVLTREVKKRFSKKDNSKSHGRRKS
ncbi:MAG: helix-turn-helix transcriptional regulator [Firmicutes bacterium]|nr:helix-turn-helix transcriptional regulator [Bacillota bacterium]